MNAELDKPWRGLLTQVTQRQRATPAKSLVYCDVGMKSLPRISPTELLYLSTPRNGQPREFPGDVEQVVSAFSIGSGEREA